MWKKDRLEVTGGSLTGEADEGTPEKDRLEVTGGSLTGEADEGTPESGADVDTAMSSGYTRRILTAAHGSGANAFVGKGVKFKGTISYTGTVRIDGELEGEIKTDGTLLIGEEADISAKISAGTIICSGKITGNVKAVERIKLYSPAVLTGSVDTPAMSMEEGAQLNGQCAMQTTEGRPNLRAVLEPSETPITIELNIPNPPGVMRTDSTG